MAFTKRQIYYETAGNLLKKTRVTRGWSLEEVAKRINVSSKYLKAIEEEDYSLLPSQPYIYGFLKEYARFLKLDVKEVISRFEKENKIFQKDPFCQSVFIKSNDFSKLCTKKISFFDFSKFLIFLAIFVILSYLGWSIWQSFSAPKIKILDPADDFVTKNSLIEIKGKVESPETLVFINGVMVDKIKDGHFSQLANLSLGVNLIKISAQKKRGQERVVWRRIVLEAQ